MSHDKELHKKREEVKILTELTRKTLTDTLNLLNDLEHAFNQPSNLDHQGEEELITAEEAIVLNLRVKAADIKKEFVGQFNSFELQQADCLDESYSRTKTSGELPKTDHQ